MQILENNLPIKLDFTQIKLDFTQIQRLKKGIILYYK